MSSKTTIAAPIKEQQRQWFRVDADGKILGKLATRIADTLRGKGKTIFALHTDLGDHVVVLNAEKVKVSGRKEEGKQYYSHSQYPGHLKITPLKKMRAEKPWKILEEAVTGMLPKNKLRNRWMKRCHVYRGSEHPHKAAKFQDMLL